MEKEQLQEASNRIRKLDKNYHDARRQMLVREIVSIIAAAIGFIVVLRGADIGFSGNAQLGVITGIGGLITQATGYLFFRRVDSANRRIDENYNQLLSDAQNLQTLLSECDNLSSPESREEERKSILEAAKSLWLSNKKV